ncbi:O-antigen polymerase [Marinicauda pacifica]|uniref:O-antigen polymerase n=1 Tax=Marinicauda pacifica TaxID=1133559 RepID=UPI0035C7A659
MTYILIISILAIALAAGFRVGITSAIFLFGVHLVLGLLFRLFVVRNFDVPSYFYWSLLSNNFYIPIDLIVFQICVAIIFTLMGYFLLGHRGTKNASIRAANFIVPEHDTRLFKISLILFLACWLVFIVGLASLYGGIGQAFVALQRRALTFGSSVTILRIFITVAFAPLLIMIYASLESKRRLGPAALIATFALLCHMIGVFLTGGRGAMLTQLFVALATAGVLVNRRHLKLTFSSLVGAAAAIVLVGAVIVGGYAMRISAQQSIPLGVALRQALPDGLLIVSGTFPLLDLYSGAYVLTRDEGLSYGENLVNIAGRFVPRDLWPTKPDILAIEIRQHVYGDRLSGAPPTVYGEFYHAFSWLGLVVGGLFFGVLLRLTDSLRDYVLREPLVAGFYFYVVFQLSFGVLKSGLENSLFHIIYFSAGLLIIKFWVRFSGQKRAA